MTRIGIFGGSFDPVHMGHLWIGEAALRQFQLDSLNWVPVATSPLKEQGPEASDQDRLAMLRLALSGCPEHRIDEREIHRGEVSYTVDTIREYRAEQPDAELVLVIGSDSLASMPRWQQPEELLQLATLAVVQRGGEPELDFAVLNGLASKERIDLFRQSVIRMPVIEISSSQLRADLKNGQRLRFRVPRAVESMIQAQRVYASD